MPFKSSKQLLYRLKVRNKSSYCRYSISRNFDARLADGTFNIEQVRIIHRSSLVPPPPLAYSKKLSVELRTRIKKATLEAHKHGKIGGYGGEMSHYISVTNADYDPLREMDSLLNK